VKLKKNYRGLTQLNKIEKNKKTKRQKRLKKIRKQQLKKKHANPNKPLKPNLITKTQNLWNSRPEFNQEAFWKMTRG